MTISFAASRPLRRPLSLLAAAAVGLSVLTGCGSAEMQTVDGEGFTVSLPGKAERTTQTAPTPGGNVNLVLYGVQDRNSYHGVSYADMPEGVTIDLDGAVKGSAQAMKGTVASSKPSEVQGHKAVDATITGVQSNGIEGTAFITDVAVDNRLYTVMSIVKGKNADKPATHDEVRNSLRFE